MSKNIRIVAALAAVAGLLLIARVALNQPSDEVLIQTALAEAIQASKDGKSGPVLDFVSRNATYNGEGSGDRREIDKFIKQYRPDVKILNPRPTIQGDQATIVSPVELKMSLLNIGASTSIPEVTINLRRETAFKWIVVPTTQWRVASIEAPANAASNFPLN